MINPYVTVEEFVDGTFVTFINNDGSTCNSIERAPISNAPNSIEPPAVATKKLGKKPV